VAIMQITPEITVGELAAAHPAVLRIFERAGIDYCCGGRRPLGEACARAGLPLAELSARIEAAEAWPAEERDWRSVPLPELIDHIEATHHVFTRSELERAIALMTKVARVHGEAHPELIEMRDIVHELHDELMTHMMKEERVLFPRIRAGGVPVELLGAPIEVMEAEHDRCGELLRRLRALSRDYALHEGACGSYRAAFQALTALEEDLHVHIHLESNVLFPRALRR
jgi:regulator of cell morphogenesis and NO signaling